MDEEYAKHEPNPNVVKMLSKKLQILNNTFDGVISLSKQDCSFNAFLKWTLDA